jgi:hypothetical protein
MAQASVLLELCAAQLEKRADHVRLRIQAGESARTCVSKDANEDRLDLIVEGMRRHDWRAKIQRCGSKEIPSLGAPLVLSRGDSGRDSDNALESERSRARLHAAGRQGCMIPGSMIESGDDDRRAGTTELEAHGIEKDHGIKSS